MVVMLRAPASEAPAPTSTATFSFTEYSMRNLPHEAMWWKVSGISDEGVPG